MKAKNRSNILPAVIIALGLIIASFVYAYANRYEIKTGYHTYRYDKWTSTYSEMKEK